MATGSLAGRYTSQKTGRTLEVSEPGLCLYEVVMTDPRLLRVEKYVLSAKALIIAMQLGQYVKAS